MWLSSFGQALFNSMGNTTIPHIKFSKINRWENTTCYITEKLDGSNAVIYIDKGKNLVKAGSRNQWLTPGKTTDNFGFAIWVEANKQELLKLPDGYHYGEWIGSGIQRKYSLKEKKLYLFNLGLQEFNCQCVNFVPLLATIQLPDLFNKLEALKEVMQRTGSILDKHTKPEGLIVNFNRPNGDTRLKVIWDKQ